MEESSGAAASDAAKALELPRSMTARPSSESGQPAPKYPKTPKTATRHSDPAVAWAEHANRKRSPKAGFVLDSRRENGREAAKLDWRDRAPKVVSSRSVTASSGGSGRFGRAVTAPAFAGENLISSPVRRVGRVDEADAVQWHLALRRRCPSIIASAEEYDDDLVRLCRLSAGL